MKHREHGATVIEFAFVLVLFLTFLLGGFALVCMHQCHRNLLRTTFVSASAPPMFAETPGVLHITLGNEARFVRYGIEIVALDGKPGSIDIPVNGQAQAAVRLQASLDAFIYCEQGSWQLQRWCCCTDFWASRGGVRSNNFAAWKRH